ncbi:hypothetical protein ACUR5C_02500 [Aliikangiella sp. IMCC44653]
MMTIRNYFIIFLFFPVGCESEYVPSVSDERASYESLFLEIQGDGFRAA